MPLDVYKKFSVNDEDTYFLYKKNIIEDNEYLTEIDNWINSLGFRDGWCISGKRIPRQQLWFHQQEKYFCEEWKVRYERWVSAKYDDFLYGFQGLIDTTTKDILSTNDINIEIPKINSCLINKYRDENDSIRPHRDTSKTFGLYPTILIYSHGQSRRMKIQKAIWDTSNFASLRLDKENPIDFEIELEANSLFIMAGASQKYFVHEIPKEDKPRDITYSITFREFI